MNMGNDSSHCIKSYFANRTTAYSVYSPETYEGHWKQLTVRTTRTKQAMAVVFFNPQVKKNLKLLYITEKKGLNFHHFGVLYLFLET